MPLPPLTPGTSAKPGSLPTHLYKRGRIGGPTKLQDHFQIGDWVEGKPGEVAVWNPTPNIPFQARGGGVLVDEGLYYGKSNTRPMLLLRLPGCAGGARMNERYCY